MYPIEAPADEKNLKHLGEGSNIDPRAIIRRPHLVSVGKHTNIDYGVYVTTAAEIGDYCHIATYVVIAGGKEAKLIMGNFSTITFGSILICRGNDHLGGGLIGPTIPPGYEDKIINLPIIMESFVNIGAHSTILPGVKLAQGTVIGAGSLVLKNTEPWTIYVGVPARPMKSRPSEKMLQFAKELGYFGGGVQPT